LRRFGGSRRASERIARQRSHEGHTKTRGFFAAEAHGAAPEDYKDYALPRFLSWSVEHAASRMLAKVPRNPSLDFGGAGRPMHAKVHEVHGELRRIVTFRRIDARRGGGWLGGWSPPISKSD